MEPNLPLPSSASPYASKEKNPNDKATKKDSKKNPNSTKEKDSAKKKAAKKDSAKKKVPPTQIEAVLRREYSSRDIPGAVGRDVFYSFLRRRYDGIPRRRLMAFLKRQRAWQLHQPVYRVPTPPRAPPPAPSQAGRRICWI